MAEKNIFRQAKQLLHNKHGEELTEEELDLVAAALIPLMLLPRYQDMEIREGLEELARIADGKHC